MQIAFYCDSIKIMEAHGPSAPLRSVTGRRGSDAGRVRVIPPIESGL